MRRNYPAPMLYGLIGLLLVANTIKIGAMADALALLVGGGTIWVESQVGKGSTFAFTLPLPIDQHVQPANGHL